MRLKDRNLSGVAREETVARARRFFMLARQFAAQMAPPVLLITAGLMGSGKSRLAGAVAAETGMAVLASDAIRKELAYGKSGPARRDASSFGAGIYSAQWTERTYGEMFARAEVLLREGRSVILDATFSKQRHRKQAFALAKRRGAEAWFAECRVPDEVALARLRKREQGGASISDGRAELFPSQKAAFDPVMNLPAGRHVIVDTDQPKEVPPRRLLERTGIQVPPPFLGIG
jgi:hypothetical protein